MQPVQPIQPLVLDGAAGDVCADPSDNDATAQHPRPRYTGPCRYRAEGCVDCSAPILVSPGYRYRCPPCVKRAYNDLGIPYPGDLDKLERDCAEQERLTAELRRAQAALGLGLDECPCPECRGGGK